MYTQFPQAPLKNSLVYTQTMCTGKLYLRRNQDIWRWIVTDSDEHLNRMKSTPNDTSVLITVRTISFTAQVYTENTHCSKQYTVVYAYIATGSFGPSRLRTRLQGLNVKQKMLKTRSRDLKISYSNCPSFIRDKIALYFKESGAYCTLPLKIVKK